MNQTLLQKLETERDRIIEALKEKNASDVSYPDLVSAVDKIQKNINLLKGDATEYIKQYVITEGEDKPMESSQQPEEDSGGRE